MKILYIGWLGGNNIGDELIFEAFKEFIEEKFGTNINVTGINCGINYDNFEGYDVVCLGGGSILIDSYIKVIYNAFEQGKKIIIWGSGYDDLLGEEFINRICSEKSPAYVYSDETEEFLNQISNEAIFFGVRGPITYKILKQSGLNMEKIKICGDSGFLLKIEEKNPYNFKKSDNVVGINIGTVYNNIYGGTEKEIIDDLLRITNELIDKGYKIYLFSMWSQDIDIIMEFYKNIKQKEKVFFCLDNKNAKQVGAALKECVFTINYKLHASVLSSLAGTPFICIAYRMKAYDFTNSINCKDLVVSTDSTTFYSDVKEKIEYIENNNIFLVEKFTKHIREYKQVLSSELLSLKECIR